MSSNSPMIRVDQLIAEIVAQNTLINDSAEKLNQQEHDDLCKRKDQLLYFLKDTLCEMF